MSIIKKDIEPANIIINLKNKEETIRILKEKTEDRKKWKEIIRYLLMQ